MEKLYARPFAAIPISAALRQHQFGQWRPATSSRLKPTLSWQWATPAGGREESVDLADRTGVIDPKRPVVTDRFAEARY